MNDLQIALDKALEAFKAEYGADAQFEEGDEVVFEFNNCSLILGFSDNRLNIHFIGGKSIKVDHTVKIYEVEGGAEHEP